MNSTMLRAWSIGLVTAAGAAGALANGEQMRIQVFYNGPHNSVNPIHPSANWCTVRLSAQFDPSDYALAGLRTDLIAAEGAWIAGSNRLLPPFGGGNTGAIVGSRINGIVAGQLHFPPAGIFANPVNPARFFEARWTTTNFTSRNVLLTTSTSRFDVYPSQASPSSASRLSALLEGDRLIRVRLTNPAPGTLALLGLAALSARRRR